MGYENGGAKREIEREDISQSVQLKVVRGKGVEKIIIFVIRRQQRMSSSGIKDIFGWWILEGMRRKGKFLFLD